MLSATWSCDTNLLRRDKIMHEDPLSLSTLSIIVDDYGHHLQAKARMGTYPLLRWWLSTLVLRGKELFEIENIIFVCGGVLIVA
jgi:hypothetical protein